MKTLEYNSGYAWIDWLLNQWPFCLDESSMRSIFAWAWDNQGMYFPADGSLFYNGYIMLRIEWPLGIWLHLKPARNLRIQTGAGWKGNGRFGLTLRFQTDQQAAAGVHGPNFGQASDWNRGTA